MGPKLKDFKSLLGILTTRFKIPLTQSPNHCHCWFNSLKYQKTLLKSFEEGCGQVAIYEGMEIHLLLSHLETSLLIVSELMHINASGTFFKTSKSEFQI